jgi:4-oxalomesaconate tautomerase
MLRALPCSIIRGGTSKGVYFLASDLPTDVEKRNQMIMSVMGSPDERQIDGLGGAHPLTSKVAIVSLSDRENADIDYLFLQVSVDKALVSDQQNCGNLLAGVGPFALEENLFKADDGYTDVRIHMVNTGAIAVARVQTPNCKVTYEGDAVIDGVPGSSAPITIDFLDIAGSSCGSLLPSGNAQDIIDGVAVTCIDNGMPVVLISAVDLGINGTESPTDLEANQALKDTVEKIRLQAGELMNLGDVSQKTVPKMSLISAAANGGLINTRTFIPHRVHEAIGVLGSVSVATAAVLKETVANNLVNQTFSDGTHSIEVEHPTGQFTVEMEITNSENIESFKVSRSALLRTARLLMCGSTMVHES